MSIFAEIMDLITDLDERIKICTQCGGTGLMPDDESSACDYCGGQGETLEATPYMGIIKDLKKKLNEFKDISFYLKKQQK
jgi:RecJ-like exonuclease